jgi:ribosome-associated protein
VDTRLLESQLRERIGDGDFTFTFSRSGGPGGQNVNKVSTRVTLLFDLTACAALSDHERATIRRRLAGRVTKEDCVKVTSSRHRTQIANRGAAVDRLFELLADALTPPRPRKPTAVPRGQRRRRLQDKRVQGEKRKLRGRVDHGD